MNKIISLIKATMTEGMNIFKISTKKNNTFSKIILPIILTLLLMSMMYSYSKLIIKPLRPIHMEFALLTLFILLTSIMTIMEGIYKTSSLLFNCKDDNLLFSLPIKRSAVLFIRIFKFYIFELLYNSLFLIPPMIVYAVYTKPNISYYPISLIGLLLFPIIPILISCIIGSVITYASSKFKSKNIVQTIITFIFILAVMTVSYNSKNIINNIAKNVTNINDLITKLYYPAGAYIKIITSYSSIELIKFIIINISLFIITIIIIGKTYFNINSNIKSTKTKHNTKYKIKSSTPKLALIKKEINRFITSPVFITNAGFGLVLFIIGCIFITIKFDSVMQLFIQNEPEITIDILKNYIPVILFGFICFTSFMTSITSSMISLEGKSFNILKSLPIKPYDIIKSKVNAAILLMLPFIFIGDIIIFIKFKFNIINIILILISSILLPLISETIGIIINLKYPKMDAKNDTEVVKQSLSSSISVFIGMGIIGITTYLLFKALNNNISNEKTLIISLLLFTIIYLGLLVLLHKTCDKNFESIEA